MSARARRGRLRAMAMEGAEWLRTQLAGFACASCGRSYRAGHIKVLAQRDDLFFVDLTCRSCGAEAVAIVTIEVDAEQSTHLDAGDLPRAEEPADANAATIVADDVLAMHEFLRDFDGDFQRLFRTS